MMFVRDLFASHADKFIYLLMKLLYCKAHVSLELNLLLLHFYNCLLYLKAF